MASKCITARMETASKCVHCENGNVWKCVNATERVLNSLVMFAILTVIFEITHTCQLNNDPNDSYVWKPAGTFQFLIEVVFFYKIKLIPTTLFSNNNWIQSCYILTTDIYITDDNDWLNIGRYYVNLFFATNNVLLYGWGLTVEYF